MDPTRYSQFKSAATTNGHISSSAPLMLAMNRAPSKPTATRRRPQPKAQANPKPINRSPRSPLKDLNAGPIKSRSSCSSSASTSSEAPSGCLRFRFSSSSSRNHRNHHPPHCNSRIPRNPTTIKYNPRLKSCKPLDQIGDGSIKPAAEHVPKVIRLRRGQIGNKVSQNKAVSAGSDDLFGNQSGRLEEAAAGKSGKDFQFTPVGCKTGSLECGVGEELGSICDKIGDANGNTPPAEVTVSPEIQCGSTVMSAATPVCFGTGHVLSGVSDKRKCRPRGVLVVGDNCKGIDELNISMEELDGIGDVNSGHTSVPPLPVEASVHWLLSPCDEEIDRNGESELLTSVHLQSPLPGSSGYGISSNLSEVKNSKINAGTSSLTRPGIGSKSSSLASPSKSLLFQCLPESPSDNMACCLSHSPPCTTSNDEGVVSCSDEKSLSNLAGQKSPSSMDSLGSENEIQTPDSSSSTKHMRLPWFDEDDEKHAVESNLDCAIDGQQRTSFSSEGQVFASEQIDSSFEFDCHKKPASSIEFSQLQYNWDKSSWISDAIVENEPWSQLRISWRDDLSSHLMEMDYSDCCRCLSDEENRNDQYSLYPASPKPKLPEINTVSFMKIFDVKSAGCMNRNENSTFQKEIPCAESISLDGGSLAASGDSGWDMCYKK